MRRNNQSLVLVLIIVIVVIVAFIFSQYRGTNSVEQIGAADSIPKKQLSDVEILETVNFGTVIPQFRLNVQSENATYIPTKIALIDKTSHTTRKELPVVVSEYPSECMTHKEMDGHDQMGMSRKKWNTDWFTMPELGPVDTSYTPKLAENYLVELTYADSYVSYDSINEIKDVCYQVSKNVPMTPNPRDEVLEKE